MATNPNDPMAVVAGIANQFVQYYYTTFDGNREGLLSLYRPISTLTWEGTPTRGAQEIVAKLKSLPFQQVVHQVLTLDAQPSADMTSSIVVMVTGQLKIDDSQPIHFSQTFHLIPEGSSYFVFNDIFRLNLG